MQEKIKELESQLLTERKLAAATQNADTDKAEKYHQEEKNKTPLRPALTENNSLKPSLPFSTIENSSMNIDCYYSEKENIPDMAEKLILPKRTGRVSVCPMTRPSILSANTLRRNSLIPLPSGALQLVNSESESNCLPLQSHCDSPKEIRGEGRKKGSKLRRSLQKKSQEKLQTQQNIKKVVGVNVGMEKVRLSVGSRGKMGYVRNGNKEKQQQKKKNSQKEKERRWNVGTLVKTVI